MTDYSIYEPKLVLDIMLNPLYRSKENIACKALVRMIYRDYLRFTYNAYSCISENYYRFAYKLYQEETHEQETN